MSRAQFLVARYSWQLFKTMYVTQKEIDAVSEAADQYGSIVAACSDDKIADGFIRVQEVLLHLQEKMMRQKSNQDLRAEVNKHVRRLKKESLLQLP